eukprot:3880149-Prymnesium_polylepis.1
MACVCTSEKCVVFRCGGSGLQRPVRARSCAIRAWAVGHARIGTSMSARTNAGARNRLRDLPNTGLAH